ncbi:nectin-3-like protein isoform X2 [Anoplopoma fimbria]|uniref:nectin-3-like protein isoform X2 n=1 Tax=Anoplopoma fimbria TaxID=229290 RepID=UPI0023EBA5A3|nr:nectin-3-like protein isoform X2 [Anoplopoma fimbria]
MSALFFWRSTSFLLVSTLLQSTVIRALQVIGGNMTVVHGGTTILPCKLIDTTEPITQISWRKEPQNDNFFTILPPNEAKFVNGRDDRFEFIGNFGDNNGSLRLSNVKLTDEATFTCIFTLFPSGNVHTAIPLNLLVPPFTSVKDNFPTLGNEEVSLGTCIAAGSKPPAKVQWLTGTLGDKVRATIHFTQHANGTTTTVSSLFGVPTREINGHMVTCVITGAAMSKEERLPFTIQILFSPIEVDIHTRSEDSFECVAEAKPEADFTWSRVAGVLEPIPAVNGRRQGTPWTGRQPITGQTYRDRQPLTLTFTPTGNFRVIN